MKNYKELLNKLLTNKLGEKDFLTLKTNFKNLFKKALKNYFSADVERLFRKHYGSDYLDVLSQELFLRILTQRETLMSLEFIHENYLLAMAQNIVHFHLASELKMLKAEVNFNDLLPNDDPEQQEELKLEETLSKVFIDYLEDIEVKNLVDTIAKTFSKKDLETLCWYISKSVFQTNFTVDVKRDLLYKRWERLKPKLSQILPRDLLHEQKSRKFCEAVMSEICQKLHLIKK